MKRTLACIAAAGALIVQVGVASAQEKGQETPAGTSRGAIHGAAGQNGNTPARHGGKANPYVSDSMAHWHSGRPSSDSASLGAGDGVFDDKGLPKDKLKPRGLVQHELAGSIPLGGRVSFKAAGRYENLGSVADKGLGGLGGNLGLKISF